MGVNASECVETLRECAMDSERVPTVMLCRRECDIARVYCVRFFYLTDTEYFRIKFPFYGVFLNRLYSLTFARLLMNENTDAFSECFVFLLRLMLLRWCV